MEVQREKPSPRWSTFSPERSGDEPRKTAKCERVVAGWVRFIY